MVEKLTEIEKDFLKEMTSIAAGNASTLLSKKTGQEITLSVSTYELISHDEVEGFVGTPKGIVVCTFAKLRGKALGSVMLVFSTKSAFILADLLQKKKVGTTKWLSERDQEELLQMGNSVFQCYSKALANFVDIDLRLEDLKIFSTIGDAVMELLLAVPVEGPILALRNELTAQEFLKAKVWFLFFLRMEGALSLIKKANLE